MRYRLVETVGAVKVYHSSYGMGRRIVDTTRDSIAMTLICMVILTVCMLTLLFK